MMTALPPVVVSTPVLLIATTLVVLCASVLPAKCQNGDDPSAGALGGLPVQQSPDGTYYQFVPRRTTFRDAMLEAAYSRYRIPGTTSPNDLLRGQLAVVDSAAEDSFILSLAEGDKTAADDASSLYWLAGSDSDGSATTEGIWRWYTGHTRQFFGDGASESIYTNWAPNEPNSYRGRNEDCLSVFYGRDPTDPYNGKWNDESCTAKHAFVIKYAPPVIVSSGNNEYEFLPTMLRWIDAVKVAARSTHNGLPGNLLTLESKAEEDAIQGLVDNSKIFDKELNHNTWLGARWVKEDGNWQWVQGDEAGTIIGGKGKNKETFTKWGKDQPQLIAGADVACIRAGATYLLWWASQCEAEYQVIIEYERPADDVILDLDAATYNEEGGGNGKWLDLSTSRCDATFKSTVGKGAKSTWDEKMGAFRVGPDYGYFETAPLNIVAKQTLSVEVSFYSKSNKDLPAFLVSLSNRPQAQYISMGTADVGLTAGMGRTKYVSGLGEPETPGWHHAVAVFVQGESGGSFVALDGELGSKTRALNLLKDHPSVFIGGDNNRAGFGGYIQYVRIYRRALDEEEIITLFEEFAQRNSGDEVVPSQPPSNTVERPLANLRGDYDAHAHVDNTPSRGTIKDTAGTGKWEFLASREANSRDVNAHPVPLTYRKESTHSVLRGDSYVNLESVGDLNFPALSGGAVVAGDQDKAPDASEVSVHPGNPEDKGERPFLVARWATTERGPIRVRGTIRNLGTRSQDGQSFAVLVEGSIKYEAQVKQQNAHEFDFIVDLEQDTVIDFSVGPNENFLGDDAGLSVSITVPSEVSPTLGPNNGALTPPGFLVLGFNENIDLSKTYTNDRSQGATARFVDEKIEDTRVQAIEFVKAKSGQIPYNWFGFRLNVTCGEEVTFGAWVKFIDRLPDMKSAEANNFGLKHHGDPDGSSQGANGIYNDFMANVKPNRWTYVTKTWVPDYTATDLVILIFDSVNAGQKVRFANINAEKKSELPNQNFALHNFNRDVTGEGFLVLGSNTGIDLTKRYSPASAGGSSAVYVDDAPPRSETNALRSVEFTKAKKDGQLNFNWFGQKVTVCKGDRITFSVWIKFVGKVPPMNTGNFGLKHHGDPDGSSSGGRPIYDDFLRDAKPDTWMHISKTWIADYSYNDLLIIIFDTAPAGQVIRFSDVDIYKQASQPILFFNGRSSIEFTKSNVLLPEGDSDYSIEAWVRLMEPPPAGKAAGIVGWGDYSDGISANQLKINANGRVVNSWGLNNLVASRATNITDGDWHHIAVTFDGAARQLYYDGRPLGRDIPKSETHDAAPTGLRIGVTGDSDYFNGYISHVRIWRVFRAQKDIFDYRDQVLPDNAPGLVGEWRLNDGESTAVESSGSGFDGIIHGAKYQQLQLMPPVKEFGVIVRDAAKNMGITRQGPWKLAKATKREHYNKLEYYSSAFQSVPMSILFQVDVPTSGFYEITFNYPMHSKETAATNVPISFTTAQGLKTVFVNQSMKIRAVLGIFRLIEGTLEITISNRGVSPDKSIVAGRMLIKAAHRPEFAPDRWGACRTRETTFKKGNFEVYSWFRDPIPQPVVIFSVQAKNDAHIAFAPRQVAGPGAKLYEIVIGGWGNTQSVIRREPQGPNKVVVKRSNLLSADEPRKFWASAINGHIRVGTGSQIGKNVFMEWTDPEPMDATYFGVNTGFGSNGHWSVCASEDLNLGTECGQDQMQVKPATQNSPAVCRAYTICEPGFFELTKPTPTSDRTCQKCAAGQSDVRADNECVKCSTGLFVPAGSIGPCANFKCNPGTADVDRKASTPCKACPPGRFQDRSGQTRCRLITKCGAGKELMRASTLVSDSVCKPCDLGVTYRDGSTQSTKCQPVRQCLTSNNEEEASPPTLSSNRVCRACQGPCKCNAGSSRVNGKCTKCPAGFSDMLSNNKCVSCKGKGGVYCAPGSVGRPSLHRCAVGTADLDLDPSTPCVPCDPTKGEYSVRMGMTNCRLARKCTPGTYVVSASTATSNTICGECVSSVTYSVSKNAKSCSPVTAACPPGQTQSSRPTPSSDRQCATCVQGTFKAAAGNGPCLPVSTCPYDQVPSATATPTSDIVCTATGAASGSSTTTRAPGGASSTGGTDMTAVAIAAVAVVLVIGIFGGFMYYRRRNQRGRFSAVEYSVVNNAGGGGDEAQGPESEDENMLEPDVMEPIGALDDSRMALDLEPDAEMLNDF